MNSESYKEAIVFAFQKAVEQERERCADIVESLTMQEILLAMGEMSAQERRNCEALKGFIVHKIRSSDE